jgi:hypothetical protein
MEDPLKPPRKGLAPESAFVVHLAGVGSGHGRVEHVTSGRSLRFDSPAELMQFMQQIIADGASTGDARVSA